MARDQRGIGEVADPHREIDAVFHQIDHLIRQPQFAGDFGIAFQIGRHHRADMEAAEADRRGDHQPSARQRALALGGAFGFLDIAENAPHPLQIARADIGQRHLPGGPLQQPRAEALLQRRDQPRHRRMATDASLRAAGANPLRSATATKACMASRRSMGLFHILQ